MRIINIGYCINQAASMEYVTPTKRLFTSHLDTHSIPSVYSVLGNAVWEDGDGKGAMGIPATTNLSKTGYMRVYAALLQHVAGCGRKMVSRVRRIGRKSSVSDLPGPGPINLSLGNRWAIHLRGNPRYESYHITVTTDIVQRDNTLWGGLDKRSFFFLISTCFMTRHCTHT